MKRHLLFVIEALLLCMTGMTAQAQTDFYYYKGEKIPLTLNENKVVVSIPKDRAETSQRIRAKVQLLDTINDNIFDSFVIARSDFEKLTAMDTWEEDAKSVILTSSYFTENGKEVYTSPYLNVRLKKEEDIDLLVSYTEIYKLRIIEWNNEFLPLWSVLALTPESEKNPLECANELYETGNFVAAEADFVATGNLHDDTTSIQSIAQPTTGNVTIYDLQGRRLSGKPARGIYIESGKKKVKK